MNRMSRLVLAATLLIYVGPSDAIQFPVPISLHSSNACSAKISEALHNDIIAVVDSIDLSVASHFLPRCGENGWVRVAHINMSNPGTSCPSGWSARSANSVTGCGRLNDAHVLTSTFSVKNQNYTHVCGRILAIQGGVTNGFGPTCADRNIFQSVDGVIISHPGTQRRIWTFAAMISQQPDNARSSCPCAYRNENWPNLIPQFIGMNYFCDSGNPSRDNAMTGRYYTRDVLWDGEGCSFNTCCQFNKPPWFVRDLGEPVNKDLDVSILVNGLRRGEDIIVTDLELYIW